VRAAFLGGEFGDWSAKRKGLEDRLQIRTFTAYGTSDVGLIGFECTEQNGYHVADGVIVQICDTEGRPLPDGHPGEVVVTALNPVWPMIRLGTGDASYLQLEPCRCGRTTPRIAPLLGRTRQSLKIREIFVYPRHIDAIRARIPGVTKAQGRARRRGGRDEIDLILESERPISEIEGEVRSVFESVARVRVGTVSAVSPGRIETSDLLVDERE
jgi:phenylacetate-CoA ligase